MCNFLSVILSDSNNILVYKESLNESTEQKSKKEASQSIDVTRKQLKVLLAFNVQSNRGENKAEMERRSCLKINK